MGDLTRKDLVQRLAEVSHRTWLRQKAEDLRTQAETEIAELPTDVAEHDEQRAEDTVRKLEELGLWPPGH